MSLYNNKDLMRQIIISHYDKPTHRIEDESLYNEYLSFHNQSISCIDNIKVFIKIDQNTIVDAKFSGIGCAISTASTDILCDILVNKDINEAQAILNQYLNMINHDEYDEEVLEELNAFNDIYKQQNRIKCSLIGFEGFKAILKDKEKNNEQ